jgi:hypothetical protein
MKQARIILPHLTQKGARVEPRVEYRFLEWITDSFGGCTTSQGFGYWCNPVDGKRFREPVTIVDIAMEETLVASARLMDIAKTFKDEADQVCVYVCHVSGEIEFVE